jgi:acyl-CoA synthetase (AMP-forming)/AMP-acid ligase II
MCLCCRYGIMGIGAVCHTLNPRLSDSDIAYIADHGQVGQQPLNRLALCSTNQ